MTLFDAPIVSLFTVLSLGGSTGSNNIIIIIIIGRHFGPAEYQASKKNTRKQWKEARMGVVII